MGKRQMFTMLHHRNKVGDLFTAKGSEDVFKVVKIIDNDAFYARPLRFYERRLSKLLLVQIGAWICGTIVAIFVIGVLSLVLCSNG